MHLQSVVQYVLSPQIKAQATMLLGVLPLLILDGI